MSEFAGIRGCYDVQQLAEFVVGRHGDADPTLGLFAREMEFASQRERLRVSNLDFDLVTANLSINPLDLVNVAAQKNSLATTPKFRNRMLRIGLSRACSGHRVFKLCEGWYVKHLLFGSLYLVDSPRAFRPAAKISSGVNFVKFLGPAVTVAGASPRLTFPM